MADSTSASTHLRLEDEVAIMGAFPHYHRRIGRVERVAERDGKPYLGVRLAGVSHLVWCFEEWLRVV